MSIYDKEAFVRVHKYEPEFYIKLQEFIEEMRNYGFNDDVLSNVLDALDPDIMNHMTMMRLKEVGIFPVILRFRIIPGQAELFNTSFIDFIKHLRAVTGYGLRESKDIADDLKFNNYTVIKIDPVIRSSVTSIHLRQPLEELKLRFGNILEISESYSL